MRSICSKRASTQLTRCLKQSSIRKLTIGNSQLNSLSKTNQSNNQSLIQSSNPINSNNASISTRQLATKAQTTTESEPKYNASSPISNTKKPPTAIVMMNMGGPSTIPEVGPFLHRLFGDGEIITLGKFQSWLGPLIAKRRTPKIEEQYKAIGGSPIRKWTDIQGKEMCRRLDKLSPSTAPHKHYICFRYAAPLTEQTLLEMKNDGVTRAIAFSQYPQYSCTTTGSSLNHLWRELRRLDMSQNFKWSLIDRWSTHPKFIKAVEARIKIGLSQFKKDELDKVIIIFSAHSLPMKTVTKGDPYVPEVAATVSSVMQSLYHDSINNKTPYNSYILAWQSQVGYLPWMGPQTSDVIEGLGKQGHKHVLVVPIAFTSDHIETLFELDMENKELAHKSGITNFVRAPSLNDEPLLADAMADLVKNHLESGEVCTSQYKLNCAKCTRPLCRSIVNPIKEYEKLRDQVLPTGELSRHIGNPHLTEEDRKRLTDVQLN